MIIIFSVILFYFISAAFLRPLVVGAGSRVRAVADTDDLAVGQLQIKSGARIDATGAGEIEIKNAANTGTICAGVDTVNGSYLGTKTAQDLRVLVNYSEMARYLTTGEYGVGVTPTVGLGKIQIPSTTTEAGGYGFGDFRLWRTGATSLKIGATFTECSGRFDAFDGVTRATMQAGGGAVIIGSLTAADVVFQRNSANRLRLFSSSSEFVGALGVDVGVTAGEGVLQVGTTSGTTRANGARIGDINLYRKGANILAIEGVAGSNVRLDIARSTGVIGHIHAQAAAVQVGAQSAHELALVTADTARVRVGSAGELHFFGGTPVARQTYGAPTGTATRTTFATGSVTLPQLAERVKALIDDLRANGLLA